MRKVDTTNVREAGDRTTLPADGYVCRIVNVEDNEDKEYLSIEYDICEGEYKNYYSDLEERAGFWGGRYIRSYKKTALPFFKRMCSAINKSNPGFVFDGGEVNCDERTLINKKVGIVLRDEQYQKRNGDIAIRTIVDTEKPVEDIRAKNFKVKDMLISAGKKGDSSSENSDFVNVTDDSENPFGE